MLGLYGAASQGAGFSGVTFDVDVGSTAGANNPTFNSLAVAQTCFINHAADLGPVGTGVFDVHVALTETTTAANSGFDFGLLLEGKAEPATSRPEWARAKPG